MLCLTSTWPNHYRRKTALVLAGGGIIGFLYEVGVLTALDGPSSGAVRQSRPPGCRATESRKDCLERGATVIVFVNPMVPICNDRARICIPTTEGHCARLSEKGVGWIGEQAMRLMRAHSLESAIDALRSTNPRVELLHLERPR